ncbi:uncharacterized protein LOC126792118 [Argentina anserina]|uniref:uncharacterized protein LOC126792118 n=1 Tax=Argentina anserina TaxID=57926 RepID=UPI0021765084|nr:uncharacterized protein LOC126792118 [Potentilla anserina]
MFLRRHIDQSLWNEIRLLDYKRVNDFNKDMLRLKARLNLCGKELTEDDMIQKTLSTFPTLALILANQYRLEHVGTKKIPEANYGKVKDGKNPKAKGTGCPSGHGATGPSGHKMKKAPKNPQAKRDRVDNEPCYRCGDITHWYKNCQTSNRVVANYKRYRESREQQAHYMEEEGREPNVNLTILDFNGKMDHAKSSDTPDFD